MISAPVTVLSQGWEWVYGDTPRLEKGYEMIQLRWPNPCAFPPQQHFLFVGSTDPLTSDKDIYVARVDQTGAKVWEQTYDIGGVGKDDIAYGVIEDHDGRIVIVGTHDGAQSLEMFLLRLNCDGSRHLEQIISTAFYPDDIHDDVAKEVIHMPPTIGGTIHDYAIAGYTDDPNLVNTDAVIVRVGYNGGMFWGMRYQSPQGGGEAFNALCKAGTNDIVAVGHQDAGTELNGFGVRVDGANGLALGPNRGSVHWGFGNSLDEEIHSVIEMKNPAENNGIAVTGKAMGNQILLSRVNNGNFAVGAGVDYAIAVPGNQPDGIGLHIEEVPNRQCVQGTSLTQSWDIAITGAATHVTPGLDTDVFLYTYRNPFNAGPPVSVIANRFGGGSSDTGESVNFFSTTSPVPLCGFTIGGHTLSDLGMTNDIGDAYLIKTDLAGQTGCETPTTEVAQPVQLVHPFDPIELDWGVDSPDEGDRVERDWGILTCESGPIGSGIWNGHPSLSMLGAESTRSFGHIEAHQTGRTRVPFEVAGGYSASQVYNVSLPPWGFWKEVHGSHLLFSASGEHSCQCGRNANTALWALIKTW